MVLLQTLSISKISEDLARAKFLANPLDICRSSLAELLSSLMSCDLDEAYKSIQWPNNIFNGDLSVTVPRLQPGCKPTELSAELVDKVWSSFHS
jgi:arginyl-tRNA synthetase